MNDNKIRDVLDIAYKKYGMMQNPIEIKSFAEFYSALNCKNILEIGTCLGGSFYVLCKLSNINGKKISIDCPDVIAPGSELVRPRQNEIDKYLEKFAEEVIIIRDNSKDIKCLNKLESNLNGDLLDFIFIDGDHTYEGVKYDFENYKKYLKDGGYIAFHDIDFPSSTVSAGCEVYKFWEEIKSQYKFIEYKQGSFGGIGIIQVFKYKKNLNIQLSYEKESSRLYISDLDFSELDTIVSVRDMDTKIPIYFCTLNFRVYNNTFFIIPQFNYDFLNDDNFSGFLVEFYDMEKNFIFSKTIKIKDRKSNIEILTRNHSAFDCLFINYKQFFYDKIYDNFIDDNIQTVIDVGANVGLFANYISLKKNVKLIHALEPVSHTFNELKKQFYYYNNVKCHKLAIHYKSGKDFININDTHSILNTFLTFNDDKKTTEEVDLLTLPEFLDIQNLITVDLIKLDVEGLEYEILNSINDQQILRSKNWLIEYHTNDDGKSEILQNRFSRLGYKVTNVPDNIPNNLGIQGFFFAKKG